MKRPHPDSQAGRILRLLESANGGKVSLLEILNLRISQYSARIHDLRHNYGFKIDNGSEPGRPDHTWFRLKDREFPAPDARADQPIESALRDELENGKPAHLFSAEDLEHGAAWKDEG